LYRPGDLVRCDFSVDHWRLWNIGSPGQAGDDSVGDAAHARAMNFNDANFQTARVHKHSFAISRRDAPEL